MNKKLTSLKFDEKIYKSTDPSSVTDNQKKYKESNAMAYQNQITKYPVIKSNKKKTARRKKDSLCVKEQKWKWQHYHQKLFEPEDNGETLKYWKKKITLTKKNLLLRILRPEKNLIKIKANKDFSEK